MFVVFHWEKNMNRSTKRSHIGNVNNLASNYNEPRENLVLVGNGPSESMSKAMAENEKKEFIQGIIPSFVAASSQNVIE